MKAIQMVSLFNQFYSRPESFVLEWRVGGERSPHPIFSGSGFPLNVLGIIFLKCLQGLL